MGLRFMYLRLFGCLLRKSANKVPPVLSLSLSDMTEAVEFSVWFCREQKSQKRWWKVEEALGHSLAQINIKPIGCYELLVNLYSPSILYGKLKLITPVNCFFFYSSLSFINF